MRKSFLTMFSTMFIFAAIFAFLLCAAPSFAAEGVVAWDYANPPANLAGFRLYRSTVSGECPHGHRRSR